METDQRAKYYFIYWLQPLLMYSFAVAFGLPFGWLLFELL